MLVLFLTKNKGNSMDLDFTYKSVRSEEFERRKELLILNLTEWIAPKMNAIHHTNHSSNFWVPVLEL